jgi:hypothetical protein
VSLHAEWPAVFGRQEDAVRRLAFALLFALAGCKDPTSLTGVLALHIDEPSDELVIATESVEPFYYAAFDAVVVPAINWAPCTDPATCRSVRRGAPARLPLSEILVQSNEVVVYHWHLVPSGSAYAPDVIRSTRISR